MDNMNRRFRSLRWMLLTPATSVVLLAHAPAMASCWHDPNVTGLARLISVGFPLAAQRMPEIVVCDDGDVGPMIGGQFMSLPNGRTVIKLPAWQTGPRGTLHPSLAHELAHAEAHQQGLSEPFGGHGTGFMTALLRAGWDLEAERVASMIAGADQALAAARQGLGGRRIAAEVPGESRPTRLMCENVARNYFVRMPDDTVSTRTICTVVCRQAPQ